MLENRGLLIALLIIGAVFLVGPYLGVNLLGTSSQQQGPIRGRSPAVQQIDREPMERKRVRRKPPKFEPPSPQSPKRNREKPAVGDLAEIEKLLNR